MIKPGIFSLYYKQEQSTYSSTIFLQHLVRRFSFPICKIQTDNGFEFTNRFGRSKTAELTLFERQLAAYHIIHQKIRPYTPRHNGKVERSHREDQKRFYSKVKFYSFADFKHQLEVYRSRSNRIPMRPLGWRSPTEYLASYTVQYV